MSDVRSKRLSVFSMFSTVLKWMDIVENMEKTLNRFERTSDMISTIALKHA